MFSETAEMEFVAVVELKSELRSYADRMTNIGDSQKWLV